MDQEYELRKLVLESGGDDVVSKRRIDERRSKTARQMGFDGYST
jgi:hypothetical protein